MLIIHLALAAWPSLFTDCSIFPEFGQPQKRPINHVPVALVCEPVGPPASFEYCTQSCALHGLIKKHQNCSRTLCTCTERCMGTADACTGSGASKAPSHRSLPDAIDARAGNTTLLLEGETPRFYTAGMTYKLTVVPDSAPEHEATGTWYLLDVGIGRLSPLVGAATPAAAAGSWRAQCNASRASFVSTSGAAINVFWTVPRAARGTAVMRVAAATKMGNLSVSAAILNASASADPPAAGELGFACTTSQASAHVPYPLQQCQSVPIGTAGALNQSACETECFRGDTTSVYRCTRCAHVYDPAAEDGVPFEDLPDGWKCPVCGAPKAAYAKQVGSDGSARWVHEHGE